MDRIVTCSASRSISCRVPVPRPRRVTFNAPAAMPSRTRLPGAHAASQPNPGGGEHRVACAAVIERLERWRGKLDQVRVGAVLEQDCRVSAAGDQDIAGARLV